MNILIVDDHAMVREALAVMLERTEVGSTVIQAGDGAEALSVLDVRADLDIALLDLGLPGADGLSVLRQIGRVRPELPVIVLTATESSQAVREAFAAGALGYVPKSSPPETLVSALRLVMAGEVFVPSLLVRPGGAARPDPARRWRLTTRQREVLRHLAGGLSNKAIGRIMGLSEKTVKAHVTAVFRVLSVSTRREAAAVARTAGLS